MRLRRNCLPCRPPNHLRRAQASYGSLACSLATAAHRPQLCPLRRGLGATQSDVSSFPIIAALRTLGAVLPGDYLKTAFYRNVIAKPRAALRLALQGFYRIDHVYAVLEQRADFKGQFSILWSDSKAARSMSA
jgi:hypothetical protein